MIPRAAWAALALLGGAAWTPTEVASPATERPLQPGQLRWAPGNSPELAVQLTDRKSIARVGRVDAASASPTITLLPGHRSSRLEALGLGEPPTDSAATWVPGGLAFVRVQADQPGLALHDGRLHEVALPPGLSPLGVAAGGQLAVLSAEDSAGPDLWLAASLGALGDARRLTRTPSDVEHSLAIRGDRLEFLTASRESTAWCRMGATDATPVCRAYPGLELLSLASPPRGEVALAFARKAGSSKPGRHALVELSGDGRHRLLVDDVYLPPGRAPRPAYDAETRSVFYVRDAPGDANPVVRVSVDDGATEVLPLSTRGHSEAAFARYGADGWLAVVAVGDAGDEDVHNHVYVTKLPPRR